jgi:HD-GYP domain-containing protein (c-di-GMP phosphodiesterase class II)
VAPFRGIAEVAASHHEKLDGTGYRRGMTAEDLSVPSRILPVADVLDALSQDRPYRPAMPMEKVLTILDEESGEKLCPRCVGTLNELVSKVISEVEQQLHRRSRKRSGQRSRRSSHAMPQ